MKFCKDCRWAQLHTFPDDVPECRRRIVTVDVVTGVERPVYVAVWERSCYESRKKSCGPEAKYFEPVATVSASAVQPERCCLDYPRCDCNSPPEPDDDWLCFQRPAQPKVTP